jgi:ankyrin repeat protein
MDPALSPLMRIAQDGDLPAVQRLFASGAAVVTERNEAGMTLTTIAAGFGNLHLLEWLLTEGGAEIIDERGFNVWKYLKESIEMAGFGLLKPADDGEMSSLLQVMALPSEPTAFRLTNDDDVVLFKPQHAQIIVQG